MGKIPIGRGGELDSATLVLGAAYREFWFLSPKLAVTASNVPTSMSGTSGGVAFGLVGVVGSRWGGHQTVSTYAAACDLAVASPRDTE